MANMVRAMCTAMSMGARWLNAGTLTGLIFIRSASLSMRRGGARFLASVGALPPMGQQLLDSAVQLRRQSGEHVLQAGPRLVSRQARLSIAQAQRLASAPAGFMRVLAAAAAAGVRRTTP